MHPNKDLILTEADLYRLNLELTKIVDNARVDCAMIINKSGRMITSQSETNDYDKTSLSALISGNFASSSSIANILGESEFETMTQEGKNKHIFVAQIDYNSILACIFDKRTTAKRIKSCVNDSSQKLQEYLELIYKNIDLDPNLNFDVSPY